MSKQGTMSNSNGKKFEKDVLQLLGKNAKAEVVTRRGRRYDIEHEIGLIECKFFSGQPGTIWAKIFRDIYRAREDGPVIFVLGGFPRASQIQELKEFASDVAPNVSVKTFEEFKNDQRGRASAQP